MKLSRLAFGAMRLKDDRLGTGVDHVDRKIRTCLDAGVTTFDHADIYGNYDCEEIFGKALGASPSLRDQMTLVSKTGICLLSEKFPDTHIKHYDYSKAHIIGSVERSLQNLNTDRLDLLLFHRPSPLLNPDEVAAAVTELQAAGKILHVGVSNFTPRQVAMLASRVPLVANQVEASPLKRDVFLDGTLDQCIERDMIPMAWSPLAGGAVFKTDNTPSETLGRVLNSLSAKYDIGVDQLIYAWLLEHPSKMTVVLGTNDLERIEQAAASVDVALELQDWFSLWVAAQGAEVP